MKTKPCYRCTTIKSISEFNKNKSKKDGLADECSECNRALQRQRYRARQKYYSRDNAERKKKGIHQRKVELKRYLKDHPCKDCGETDPVILEFDHVRGTKFKEISRMVLENYSWKRVKEEIDKCEVRCCNCHRRRTAKQFGWK